ncbi:response regulator transcription factor [Lachnospiraceae bacterium OttesenSCG-928-D06]|nr:response regulator transcription factor [Lachnospiraceae bacterium OttesenSCG-928-D06]
MNIIAVDDEEFALTTLKEAICEALPNEEPACFLNGADALEYAKQTPIDVAFLDVRMDGIDGLLLAEKLSTIKSTTNIIFVTGYSDYSEAAYELYASGYVRKPVRARRILGEIANLRHPLKESSEQRKIKALGPYFFDHVIGRVYYDGRDAVLSPREFRLFHLFAGNPGVVFTPEKLFEQIWGDDPNGNIHTVTVHISNLRKKLDMGIGTNPSIKMQRGEGYYLEIDSRNNW